MRSRCGDRVVVRRVVAIAVLALVMLTGAGVHDAPAIAAAAPAATIDATGVALSPSATCAYGDVDITYAAEAVDQQRVVFAAQDGTMLHERTTGPHRPTYSGTEHVLAETTTPPATGSVLVVQVLIGAAPLTDGATGAFTVVYRCDATSNRAGGHNEVLHVCVGAVSTCGATVDDALVAAGLAPSGAVAPAVDGMSVTSAATPATAVVATPSFTG